MCAERPAPPPRLHGPSQAPRLPHSQVDSRYPSRQSGKFGEYDRQTISWDAPDSPGPAHYNPPGATIVTPKERPNGFGGSKTGWACAPPRTRARARPRSRRRPLRAAPVARCPDGLAPDYRPGPGDYKLPPAIGSQLPKRPPGYHPVKKSFAAASFGRGDRAGTSHMPKVGRASPGPAYMLRASVGPRRGVQKAAAPRRSTARPVAPGRKPRELRLLLDFPEAPQLSRSAGPAWGAGSNRRCPALFRTREQVSSQMKSSPNASFSKADRFYYDKRLSGSTGAAGAKAAAAFAATR